MFTCVGCEVTLCDPIWEVTPRSSEIQFHKELDSSYFTKVERNSSGSELVMLHVRRFNSLTGRSRFLFGSVVCKVQYLSKSSCIRFELRRYSVFSCQRKTLPAPRPPGSTLSGNPLALFYVVVNDRSLVHCRCGLLLLLLSI